MKRTSLFLGLTAGCLAIAGVVAARVHHFGQTMAYYFTQPNNQGSCTVVAVQTPCNRVPSATATCFTTASFSNKYYTTVDLSGPTPVCKNILHYTDN